MSEMQKSLGYLIVGLLLIGVISLWTWGTFSNVAFAISVAVLIVIGAFITFS